MLQVTIVQERLPDYRVPFFRELIRQAQSVGVGVEIITSPAGSEATAAKADGGNLDEINGTRIVRTSRLRIGSGEITYQHAMRRCLSSDIVVVEHANRHLLGLLLLFRRRLTSKPKILIWGHGKNWQADVSKISLAKQNMRSFLARQADGILAYTSSAAAIYERMGIEQRKISTLNNTVDTGWATGIASTPHGYTALYCGSLYKEKRLDILLDSAVVIRRELPDFRLIVAGNGPQMSTVADFAARNLWVDVVGRVTGSDKAMCFERASIVLNPGLVGLTAVDSLVTGRPLVWSRAARNSPEVDYLNPGNSVPIDTLDPAEFASAAVGLLRDKHRLSSLSKRARTDAVSLTVPRMAATFLAALRESAV